MSSPLLIVGAGPTGLVAALSLARRGVPIRIVDQNAGPAQASRAMVVHARNLEFYRQFGFADEILGRGVRVEQVRLRKAGHDAASIRFGDIGGALSPYPFALCYPQDDHERLLGRKLADAGVSVEWRTRLTGLAQDADGVEAALECDGRRETVRTTYVLGADGSHSAVRHALGIGFPGGDYTQLFYVADVKADADPGSSMTVSFAEDMFGLTLPVRVDGTLRLIGVVPADLAGREGLGFDDLRPRVEALCGLSVTALNWFSLYHVHHRVAERFQGGRCFLAGDAAHIHSPAGGQGMNTGIGDAINLGWKLADVARGRADAALLDSYEAERIGFARALVRTTDRAFQGIVGQGWVGAAIRTLLMPYAMPIAGQFAATRLAMFRTLSQTQIAYRRSALSHGRAGQVRGGDRLPWVPEVDNFAPLASLDWQAHLYGAARPGWVEAVEALGVTCHVFPWAEAMEEAGLARDAAYLVRPDGHVAVADPAQAPETFRTGLAACGCQPVRKLA